MSDQSSSSANEPPHCGPDAAMCCSQFYEQDIVQELMGGSFHPGGEDLSRKLIGGLGLTAAAEVLDVACGVGTTTQMMAGEFGLNATGLDFSAINVQKAESHVSTDSAHNAPETEQPCCAPGDPCCSPNEVAQLNAATPAKLPSGTARFVQGSADELPFNDSIFDGLSCECAVSTFSNQPRVAGEFFRVLKSGGTFGMTDMVLNGNLPDDFSEKAAPWTCVAKAMTIEGYQELFERAGFELIKREDHSHTLLDLASEMKRKLVMAGMGKALGALPDLGMTFSEMRAMLKQSTDLVKSGTIEYGLLVFRKPLSE